MIILGITLIAHIVFIITNAYWLFNWLDMPVHFFMGAGLALAFVKQCGWSKSISIVLVLLLAIGWEFVERHLGFSQALVETLDDAITDVLFGIVGGIIGSTYAGKK
jgi:hypothetical protein